MTFTKKYVYPTIMYFAFFLLGSVIVLICSFVCTTMYDYLVYVAPDIFPSYSPISQPQEYRMLTICIELATVFLTLIAVSYIALRLDNNKFEHITRKTEGFYTIPHALADYLREFWIADIISTTVAPAVLTATYFLIPREFMNAIYDGLLWSGSRLGEYFSVATSVVIALTVSLLARLAILPHTLKVWRANWLTCAVE